MFDSPVHGDELGSSSQKTKLPIGVPWEIPRDTSTSSRLFTTTSPVHLQGNRVATEWSGRAGVRAWK